MWNNMGALRTPKISSATHNEKYVIVKQKKWRIFDQNFTQNLVWYTHDNFYSVSQDFVKFIYMGG